MCLFPFMGGGGMQPVVPPTPKAKTYQGMLYFCLLVHFILSIMLMFVDVFLGFTNLISCMILYCATAQMHFCYLLIYIIFELMDFV